jgi:protein-tyrosine phosphatase
MIDIHSHLIWGVDDGAQTIEDSLAMLRVAAETGTTDIVATPHANDRYEFDRAELETRVEKLREASGGTPRIHLGCDFHLSFSNIESALANRDLYTVNRLRYLMVELPEMLIPPGIDRALEHLQDAGMIPVITHPERNRALSEDVKRLDHWIGIGCYAQITAQSLEGRFGRTAKNLASRWIEGGQAHFVASDAHDMEARPPRLDRAFQMIAEKHGEAEAQRLLQDNPQHVLDGTELPYARRSPRAGKRRLRFFK